MTDRPRSCSAADLGELHAARKASPVEALRAWLDRAAEIGDGLNAIVARNDQPAFQEARAREARGRAAAGIGPLAIATDGGGPIRRPASHVGPLGLKTTGASRRPEGIAGIPVGPTGSAVFAGFVNAAGCPAISIPCTRSGSGLPIGFQLFAPWGRDEDLRAIGAQ